MGFFIDRSEQNGETKIVLKKAAIFYYAMWICLGTFLIGSYLGNLFYILTVVAVIVLLIFAIPYWPVVSELKKAMRDNEVIASGSKYSLNNPLTYVMKTISK